MQQAAVQIPVTTVLLLAVCAIISSLALAMAWGAPLISTLIFMAFVACAPFLFLAYKRRRRIARFEELFPDAIDALARAVRAGHPLTTSISFVAAEMPEPIASEFRLTFEQQNLGVPLPDALRNLAERMPLADVQIFITALSIQRESGGNLGEILDNLSALIRDRFRILRQVRVHAAEGNLSMYVLVALPPMAAAGMYLLSPEYMMRLFIDPLGQTALKISLVLQIIGYLVIRRIVRIRV
jgi:tight adherence protein B